MYGATQATSPACQMHAAWGDAVFGMQTEPALHPPPIPDSQPRDARFHASGATDFDGVGGHEPALVSDGVTFMVCAPEQVGVHAPGPMGALLHVLAHDES